VITRRCIVDRARHLGPVLLVIALPILILVFDSQLAVKAVFAGMAFGLASLAGESLARAIPRAAIVAVSILLIGGVAAAIAFGWIHAGGDTPADFGGLSLIIIAVCTPLRALVIQRWPQKALTKAEDVRS
jgi:hypothetical protein